MPPSHRRRLSALPENEVGGAAVENALILSLTGVMIYAFKTTSGVSAMVKPMQQALATLVRALG